MEYLKVLTLQGFFISVLILAWNGKEQHDQITYSQTWLCDPFKL